MAKVLKKLGILVLVAVLVFAILLTLGIIFGRMSTPPRVKAQESFSSDACPFASQVYIEKIENDGKDRILYRLVFPENYQKYQNRAPGENAVENIYLICAFDRDYYEYFIESENFAVCTDDPTEENPEFARFLKDNRWGEDRVYTSNPVDISRPNHAEDENRTAAAQAKAESAAGNKTGEYDEYVFSLISCDCNGKYVYVYFDKSSLDFLYYKISVSEEEAAEYIENGQTDISEGVEIIKFDPYKYKEILEDLARFFD